MGSTVLPSSARQWRLIAVLFIIVAGALALTYYWFVASDYAVLAQGVRPEEAAGIVQLLKKESVPFELRDGGTTILVPAREADAARLDVSGGDLPLKGTVGFELFNQSDMGLTEFAQKVNYQRALQGEIARTIMTMDGIAYARVHLALPERSLFRTSGGEPRAAVALTPRPGVVIDAARVAGIQRLVAASVPDLALDEVAILNERGDLLTPEFSDTPVSAAPASGTEAEYRERISRAIAQVAPRAHVDVTVTLVPRHPEAPVSGTGAYGTARDHAIRVVLFERSALPSGEEQAISRAVASDIGLDPALGDQLSFSPAPEIAPPLPASAPPVASMAEWDGNPQAKDRLMASLGRGWTIALALLGLAAAAGVAVALRRRRAERRLLLLGRVRQQLLLEGVADAA